MNLIARVDEKEATAPLPFRVPFSLDSRLFLSIVYLEDGELLEKLAFNIARKPRHLISHVQRIFLCYKNAWPDQLYAALLDFLIVLNGRGKVISQRLLLGAKSGLTQDEFRALEEFLASKVITSQLKAVQFSIFNKGLEGSLDLVKQTEQAQVVDYDPLVLARDHIEYSQLEQAKQVLEQAVMADPGRSELQEELLGLYQSTRDNERFARMLVQMQASGLSFGTMDRWVTLENLFKGQEGNG